MVHIKIYPSNHKIELVNEAKFDTDINIPLAYINMDYAKYEMNTSINEDFLKNDINKNVQLTPLLPEQEINPESFIFNKYEERVDIKDMCKRKNNKYYLNPVYSYCPYNFSYDVTIKKNMQFSSSAIYNISVACIDDADSLDLSARLSKILLTPIDSTDPVRFNEGKSIDSLVNVKYDEVDFVFMETVDGKVLDDISRQEANIANLLDKNVNVWVGCDIHHLYKYQDSNLGESTFTNIGSFKDFELKRAMISNEKIISSDVYINLDRPDLRKQENVNIYNIFKTSLSPILILEHKGKGFEIISHNDVLKYPERYKNLIQETLLYVYLMSYKRSRRVDEWITSSVPDYEVINNKIYSKNKFIAHDSFNDLFKLTDSSYQVYHVNIYDNSNNELPVDKSDLSSYPQISYIDIINNKLVFKMEQEGQLYKEILKPTGWVSVYSNGKIYYLDQIYYHVESNITDKLFFIEHNNDLIVKLYPFKSSKNDIDLKTNLELEIKGFKTEVNGILRAINDIYIIYLNKDNMKLEYESINRYEAEKNHVEIARVEIKQSIDNTYVMDMRQLGGGLPEDAPIIDYNLLDIGNANGRPYRKSNTLIVKMPKKYEPYKDQITKAIEKYKVGEDYPIVFFEDEE